jgi:aspartyl-tRNA(Asn)/glutamyl-tRNA(Gln) amidotransferase subunit A
MLVAMQGPDAADPTTDGVKPVDPLPDLDRGVRGLRFGRVADAAMPLMSAEMKTDFAATLEVLAELGAAIEPVELPETLEAYGSHCGRIIAPEAYANWRAYVDDERSGLAAPIRVRMLSGKSLPVADYIDGLVAQRRAIDGFQRTLDRLDAIVLPTIPFPAIPVSEVDERTSHMAAHTRFVNYLNLCSLAIPTRLSKAGLPMSLQIVVRRFDDALALRIGRAFEKARGAFPKPKA